MHLPFWIAIGTVTVVPPVLFLLSRAVGYDVPDRDERNVFIYYLGIFTPYIAIGGIMALFAYLIASGFFKLS